MRRPVVGVIGNAYRIENRFATQMVGERNLRAVAEVAGALPLMFAASPEITDIGALLDAVDGVVLTGARANVHPTHFRTEPHPRHEPYDLHRDDVALALSEVCVARGVPLFGICRGLQEMNVAFGGSLHPEIRELPGRMNHRMPRLENGEIHPDPKVIFADRHDVISSPAAPLRGCSVARRSASIRCTVRASSSRANGWSSRAPRKTAPSRRSGSPMRPASPSACSGTPNTIRSAIHQPRLV
jgi:putative glutamine amidotransferase